MFCGCFHAAFAPFCYRCKCIQCLIAEKREPPACDGLAIPVASEIKKNYERRILRLPVFDTTPPGIGRQTETAKNTRHGNLTPPRISPSCLHENGWTGVSLCADEVVAKQLVLLFCGRMGTARRLHWPSLMRETAQVGLGASSRVALRFWRFVRERISVAGYDRVDPVFFKVRLGTENNPLTTKPSS